MNKKIVISAAVVIALVALLGLYVFRSLMVDGQSSSTDKMLIQVANETNKNLPLMIDKETRWDTSFAGPGNRFTYSYTLVNFTKQTADAAALEARIKPRALAYYKSSDKMKTFRDRQVELTYRYKDKDGVVLLSVSISPKDF